MNYSLPYAILAFVMIFYPLSGFIADVCCKRFKTIVISLCCLLLFLFMLCFIGVHGLVFRLYYNQNNVIEVIQSKSQTGNFILTLLLISLLLFVIGLAGYQANYIQLGLDQLFEAPNHYLGLFIHYASWSFHLGVIPIAVFPLIWCDHPRFATHLVLESLTMTVVVMLIILLIIIRWKKQWFFFY